MGVGKSTTATALAEALGWRLRDSDTDIERLLGLTGGTLASQLGVEELHRLESAVLLGALVDDGPSVIAAAASVVDDPLCRAALARRAVVVVLDATVDELMDRIPTGDHRRAMTREEVVALAAARGPRLAEIADLALNASRPTAELVSAIRDAVRSQGSRGGNPGTT